LEAIKQEFSRNVNSDSRSITASEAELDGLPSDFIAGYRKGPDGKISIPIDLSPTIPRVIRRTFQESSNIPSNVET
jgi:hypothetical protein